MLGGVNYLNHWLVAVEQTLIIYITVLYKTDTV